MSNKVLKTKINKVQFHVGSYLGNTVESGAAPGHKGVVSVEFATISEGIKGVLVVSKKGNMQFTNFIPITNITGSEVTLELEASPIVKKVS